MKTLFKVVFLAIAMIGIPLEEAEAHQICESRPLWIPAAQSSLGYWRSGYWTVVNHCRPVPPPAVTVVVPPVSVQIGPRISVSPPYNHPRSPHRHPRPPRRR